MIKKITLSLLIFCAPIIARGEFQTNAKSIFLIDYASGKVIADKNADILMPPSSMLKLMTIALTMDAVKSGELTLDTQMPVGANADYKNPMWKTASKICLTSGQNLSVRDALYGLVVMSGGDAGVVVAEKLAGSESAFTKKMTTRAREIGMEKSTFGNVSGLPHPDNLMTSRELATLADYIITNHADLYPIFATKRYEFSGYNDDWCREWGRTKTLNYNKLLFIMSGADGLKTGHTAQGGYGLVASAKRGERRLVAVMNGYNAKNHDDLAVEMKRLLEYGFKSTQTKIFFNADDEIINSDVWFGKQKTVALTTKKPFAITLPSDADTKNIHVFARYETPLRAPIAAGQKVGVIIAEQNGRELARADLIAKNRVRKSQFFGRVIWNIRALFQR